MKHASLKHVIGANYRLYPLKTHEARRQRFWQKVHFDAQALNPVACLIEVDDGRRYKLLRTEHANRHQIDLFLYRYDAASKLDFVPRLIWHDDHHILLEYIEGEHPDITTRQFAHALGHCLAKVHNVDIGTLSARLIIYSVEMQLAEIVNSKFLDERTANRVRDRLTILLPESVHTSLVYADLQKANFCFSKDGKLFLIDLGGFWRGRITDEYLFGHKLSRPPLYQDLSLDIFKESYFAAGGLTTIFDLANPVRALIDIRQAAYSSRRYHNLPVFLVRTRETYRQLIQRRVERLKAFPNIE